MIRVLILTLTLTLTTLTHAKFKSEDSVTLNLTGGNSELKTYQVESKNSYTDKNKQIYYLNGKYNYGESFGEKSIENYSVTFQFEKEIYKRLSWYFQENVESDTIANLKIRYNTDLGLKYYFTKKDKQTFNIDIAYRYTIERARYSDDNIYASKARLFLFFEKEHSKDLKYAAEFEYLPNLTESQDYQLRFTPSMTSTLNSLFSMKSSFEWKYDNDPILDRKKDDYAFILTFIANFSLDV